MESGELILRVAVLLLAAATGEAIIEFLGSPLLGLWVPDTEEKKPKRTVILNYASAALGIGIALNFDLCLFALLGGSGHISAVDSLLTGCLIGRGSNYLHGFVAKYIFKRPEPKS